MAKPETQTNDPKQAIIKSALALATEHGWSHVSMAEISEHADMSMSELRKHLATKAGLIELIVRDTDAHVCEQTNVSEDDGTARERLFDVLMSRFDHLSQNREAIAAVLRDSLADPITLARRACCFRTSMKLMLETAHIPTSGPFGALRTKGGLVVYAAAFRAWLKDDSKDMSKTMAALDKALIQAEKIAQRLPA